MMEDWRLQGQENYLLDQELTLESYRPYREDWDHDHCEFCGQKISQSPEDLTQAYTATDRYHWVCPTCFEDFKERFRWKRAT